LARFGSGNSIHRILRIKIKKILIEFNNYLILNFISDFTHNSAKMEMQMENAKPVWIIDEVLFDDNSQAFYHELEMLKDVME